MAVDRLQRADDGLFPANAFGHGERIRPDGILHLGERITYDDLNADDQQYEKNDLRQPPIGRQRGRKHGCYNGQRDAYGQPGPPPDADS